MKKRYELIPCDGQNQKSFYGKAIVEVEEDGSETLYSYNTPIIKRLSDGELKRLYDGWTLTTGRHIKAFCGLTKAEFLGLEMDVKSIPKMAPDMTPKESYAAMMGRRYATA